MAWMSRSKAAAAAAAQLPIVCPPHDQYQDVAVPAWPNYPNIGLQPGDAETLKMLKRELALGKQSSFLPFAGKERLQRVVEAYKLLPQSYKNKLWRTAADGLTANRHDNQLAPDTDFLNPEMKPMWEGMYCQAICPENDNALCPWKDDCNTFYDVRKPRWDRQRENSQICHMRWSLEEVRRRGDAALARRRVALAEKKEALRILIAKEREMSATMFKPRNFPNKDGIIAKIRDEIHSNQGEPNHGILAHVISEFAALAASAPFELLHFQCAIADYFHDGMPGFRISSTKDPKISGIRVVNVDMIRVGKGMHQDFMYLFLSHVLKTIYTQPPPRLQRIRAELIQLRPRDIKPIFTLPKTYALDALDAWRNVIQLHGTRVEDSLIPHLGLLPDETQNVYHTSLSTVKGKTPIHSYHDYLQSGKRRITIHISKKGEVNHLTKPEAERVVTFLLFVLFGPTYEAQLATHPAQFTFDAHKGHMNRLLAKAHLPGVLRLVTPYNVADSAMTEKFKDVDPDDEALAEEIIEEQGPLSKNDIDTKIEAKIREEEEEDEDDTHTAAQKGGDRFIYTFNKAHAHPVVVSDTNMIFDDNWLIYYKNNGFTRQSPYLFSMNLVDAGLHHYITNSKNKAIRNIPQSAYTVEAPFSTEVTRGPSLNYLMLGLLRGSTSNVSRKSYEQMDENYTDLCSLYLTRFDSIANRLLPIYTIPASSHSLPLFQYIAKAPLFAYHMLYDLQYGISALPSRIKWAGDREQYMAIKGVPISVFVTLDTTGYYCALANHVPSLLERQYSMKMVGAELNERQKADIIIRAQQTPPLAAKPAGKGAKSGLAGKGAKSGLAGKGAQSKRAKKDAQNKLVAYVIGKDAKSKPVASKASAMKASASTKKSTGKGYMGGNYTRKNAKQSVPQSMPGREYFFLNWLYPLTMSVNAVFYGHHAEHAYVLLQDLQKDLSYPLLFSALQDQLIHAVSLIPNVPKDLMDAVTTLTADTYDIVAPECLSRLEALYTSPHLSIFSQSVHKETLLGYLGEMKEKLSRRHPSNDTTTTMLHLLLTPDLTPDQEKVCLALALLFERLHGRIQNGTSYLGQILGITGGPDLESVDDQEAWEDLTDVLMEDMAWITDLSQQAVAPAVATTPAEMPTEMPAEAPTEMPAETPAETPITEAPKMFRLSAKNHKMLRGPVYDKMNQALKQLRPKKTRAMPMAAVRMSAAVAGGALKKTRRAKRGSRRSRRRRDD
jgi:hypothetical protein